MSRDDLVRFEGKVIDATGGGNYKVFLDNGVNVMARISGKMKRFKIRILVGDKVTVGVSPYDPSHGLIVHRHKGGAAGPGPSAGTGKISDGKPD